MVSLLLCVLCKKTPVKGYNKNEFTNYTLFNTIYTNST